MTAINPKLKCEISACECHIGRVQTPVALCFDENQCTRGSGLHDVFGDLQNVASRSCVGALSTPVK